jgi:CubicO group peptidase (beta-lactamase class C family)
MITEDFHTKEYKMATRDPETFPRIHRRLMLGALVIGVFSTSFKEPTIDSDFDPIIKESISVIKDVMNKEKIPGLSIAIIADNRVVWTEGFGYADVDHKTQVTRETIFGIQSISKTITATAVMEAAQDHLVDLDRPVSAYLPEFTVHSRFENRPEGQITIKHLLSHTAGLTMEAPVGNNCYTESPSFEEHIHSISETWLRYPVGQRYSYSNLGVDLAGYILQVRSGKSFAAYVKETLLDPVGMKNSSFDIDVIKKNENRAIGHSIYCKTVPLEVPMIPSGGFYTNAVDLAEFVRFHLQGGSIKGDTVLRTKFLNEMRTIPFPTDGQYEGYALGIEKLWNEKYRVFYYNHNGGGFGFLSSMTWYPDYRLGLVILTNSDNNSTQQKLTNQIMDLFLGQEKPDNTPAPNSTLREDRTNLSNLPDLKKYIGRYLGRGEQLDVTMNDHIMFHFNGRDSSVAQFISSDECRVVDNNYRFMPAGKTAAYVIRTNDGTTWDYNDGPNDQPGAAKEEWQQYVGAYTVELWGQVPIPTKIFLKNGYLYLTDNLGFENRLFELAPGLFFTATGESVDFTGVAPRFANLLVKKVD